MISMRFLQSHTTLKIKHQHSFSNILIAFANLREKPNYNDQQEVFAKPCNIKKKLYLSIPSPLQLSSICKR